ncbi:MAG: hypothetical protein AB1394_01270, partial [Bacteroidota bacterium]
MFNQKDVIVYIHGKGVFLNNLEDYNKITVLPNWLYNSIIDTNGNLWASGFDGVKYVGLIKYSPSGEVSYYDLTLMGLPSNFINAITINKNKIALLVFNNLYESDINMVYFTKIELNPNAHVSDIKYCDERLLVLSENELIVKSNSHMNSIKVNCKNNGKIIAAFKSNITISTNDSLYQFVESSEGIVVKNSVKIPEFLYGFLSFNFYQNNESIIFFTTRGAITYYKNEFLLFKGLKCTDLVIRDSEIVMLFDDYLSNSTNSKLNQARYLDFSSGKYSL